MVVGVWRNVVERLTPVPLAERQGFLTLPPTREAHAAAHASVAAFHQIERRQPTTPAASANSIRIAAWNLERCLYPDAAARVLQRNHVDIALLTEMDVGVLRTGQAHTIGRIAAQLASRLLLRMRVPRTASDGTASRLPAQRQRQRRRLPRQRHRRVIADAGSRSSSASTRRRTGTIPPTASAASATASPSLPLSTPAASVLSHARSTWRTGPTAPAARDRCARCSTRWMPMPGQDRW